MLTCSQPEPSRESRQAPAMPLMPPALMTITGMERSGSGAGASSSWPSLLSSSAGASSVVSDAAGEVGSLARSSPSLPMPPIRNSSTSRVTKAAAMMTR